MELRQLKQFVVLADSLNFHRAAEALNISQPPLSISIRKLELELNTQLFERSTRRVTLTAAGKAALPYARDALACVDAMVDAASATAAGTRGKLNAAFVGSAVYSLLPKAVPLFREERPGIELSLKEATTLEIIRGVEIGELDVGVIRTPAFDIGDVVLEPLTQEELLLVIPANHPLSERTELRLEDLKDETFIGYDRAHLPNFWHYMLSACETAGFQPKIVETASHMHTLMALVMSGMGIMLAPAAARIVGSDRVSYARITARGAPLMIGLATVTGRREARSTVRSFIDALRKAAALPEPT